ncbi:MAG TPA: Holliday junction branch migration protein RuvA [Candidatus Paceibacterota bacterium]|nr:Holliday junction branch migration protein RuvA [Candidatus Paceibacterota bacterium]
MIYFVSGKLESKKVNYVVVEAGGIGYKIFVPIPAIKKLPGLGEEVKLLTYFHVREDVMSLYGFLEEKELNFFKALVSISGVGPKTALGILSVAPVDNLVAAIARGESDLLQRSSGIGRKTAARVVMELKDKVFVEGGTGEETVRLMESDEDVYEALLSLGYSAKQAKAGMDKIDPKLKGVDARLKEALQKMKG